MQWRLSEEQTAYQDALRGWLSSVAGEETVRAWLADGDWATLASRMRSDGMSGVGISEARGGQGGGVVELALTAEEPGRCCAPSAWWLASMVALPALPDDLAALVAAGSPVSLLAAAECLPAEATPLPMNSAGRISGAVPRVLAADAASSFVAVADGGDGPVLRWVDASDAGVALTRRRLLDRSRSVADVCLDQVPSTPLPASLPDAARAVLDRATELAGVLLAADALGVAERMLEMAVEYSLQRRQFGVPIGSFQAVKHAAASMLVAVESGRSGIYFAAASVEGEDAECALHAAAVKAQMTGAASESADTALTLHGAIGYTWEHPLQLLYKRARLDAYLYGDPERWNERIADRLDLIPA